MRFKKIYENDEPEERKVSVFDFDDTLISLKPRIKDIFGQKWLRGPKDIDWDNVDWQNWEDEDLFVIVPDDEELMSLTEAVESLTLDEIDMFRYLFPKERFVRPVPKYKKFFTGKWGKSPSNGSAIQKYYVSPRTLDPELWHELHNEGPALDIAKDRASDKDSNIIHILTARGHDENMLYAMQDWLDSQGILLPEFRIHMVGVTPDKPEFDSSGGAGAKKKAEVLSKMVEKYGTEIDFFDDKEENIDAANNIDGVKAIKV